MDPIVEQTHSSAKRINEMIVLARESLQLHPQGHPDRPSSLDSLANHLSSRYHEFGAIQDLEEAIVLARECLQLHSHGHPGRAWSLNNLANHLSTRYDKLGAIRDLNEALALARECYELCPEGHPGRATSLHNLSVRLSTRYGKLGAVQDLDETIILAQESLELRPHGHPDRVLSLNNLANYLSTRYGKFGAVEDLGRAIVLSRECLELCPQGHPNRTPSLNNLANHLSTRYEKFGAVEDLDEAIAFAQECLELCPQGHPTRLISLNNLSVRLFARYGKFGIVGDLEEAIVLARESLELCSQGHPSRALSLNSLASCLSIRYEKFGAVKDLNDAIGLDQESLELRPQGHPDRPLSLNNLANHLSTRYDKFGAIEDLAEAIVLTRECLELRPRGHPHRAQCLLNLTNRLSTRYDKFSAASDLEEAIVLGRESLELCPQGHPTRATSLGSLAHCLSTRYDKLNVVGDLEEAIVLARECLELCPGGHPERAKSLNNLAMYLSTRHHRFAVVGDLEETILLNRECLELRPQGHPGRAMSLNNLAIRLSARYVESGAVQDLDEAIVLARESLELYPRGHRNRMRPLNNLVNLLFIRCDSFGFIQDPSVLHGLTSSNDHEEIFSLYTQLAYISHSISQSDLATSQAWIRAAEKFSHPSILHAYETSLRLLVEHLNLFPSSPQHLHILMDHTSSLAVDAFSACLRNNAPTRAVELLEQGRGVFWNQLARLRSPLDGVVACGPAGESLANEFTHLTSLIRNALGSASVDQHEQVYHLNVEMQRVVAAIRELPGLSRFLLPSLFSDLQHAASGGPIIIVNASHHSCDGLIIFENQDPAHVPLSITREYVQFLSSKVRTLTKSSRSSGITNELGVILRELWEDVVSPIVSFLQTTHPLRSRIWWCPTAEFSDLPLHAAGPYRKGQRNLADLYTSSYTPTLAALIRARRPRSSKSTSDVKRLIAIGQANAAGQNALLSVGSELAKISRDIDGAATVMRIEGEESCTSRVSEELKKSEWAHFACHGLANRQEPFKSAFALSDGHFTIEQIIHCDLENTEFAYLSACHTTVGHEEGPDEAIHLASAMQFIGFRSVIGTMWGVDDSQTNEITSKFYKHMLDEDGHLDYTRAAFALNRTMKSAKVKLDQSVLYIHLGA